MIEDGGWRSRARPSQLPPSGDWQGWLILAGRGFGKSWCGANWTNEIAETRQAGRIALVGATAADVRDTMVEGVSGILATAPAWFRPGYEPSKRRITWPNGAIATLFSAEEADRLRGPQHDAAWCDELAAWEKAQDAWDMLMFGLRLGKHPRWLVSTTPRPLPIIKSLVARVGRDVVLSRGNTFENAANLAPVFLDQLRERYEGTRLGRQEIEAAILSDMPGALWSTDNIDKTRVKQAPALRRVVVAIDPATSNKENSDETGIIVAGRAEDKSLYVLEDISGRYSPTQWATKAIEAYRKWQADRIIAEVNQGGQMVEEVLRHVDPSVSYKSVHASRGKVTRAEPISAMYEKENVHHVGAFGILEDQMTNFTSDFDRKNGSPDRVDALVWALTELSGIANRVVTTALFDSSIVYYDSNWPASQR